MPGFYGSNKHSGAVWPGLNCSLQNRIQTESWGTRPAILFKLIGPDTDEKLLHGKHLETRYTGIRIKAVCIYSDFVCFSINFLKHACRHPEKCLCVAKRNSLMCEQVSEKSWTNKSYPTCLLSPLAGPQRVAPGLELGPAPLHDAVSVADHWSQSTDGSGVSLPSLRVVAGRQWCPYLVNSLPTWAGTRYKDFTFNIRLAPSCRTWDRTG